MSVGGRRIGQVSAAAATAKAKAVLGARAGPGKNPIGRGVGGAVGMDYGTTGDGRRWVRGGGTRIREKK